EHLLGIALALFGCHGLRGSQQAGLQALLEGIQPAAMFGEQGLQTGAVKGLGRQRLGDVVAQGGEGHRLAAPRLRHGPAESVGGVVRQMMGDPLLDHAAGTFAHMAEFHEARGAPGNEGDVQSERNDQRDLQPAVGSRTRSRGGGGAIGHCFYSSKYTGLGAAASWYDIMLPSLIRSTLDWPTLMQIASASTR